METTAEFETPKQPLDWIEPFEWQQPEEWETFDDLENLAVEMLNDDVIDAGLKLLFNRDKARQNYGWDVAFHTPPAAEHYRHTYLWDSGFAIMIYSQAALFAGQAADYLESRLIEVSDESSAVWGAVRELRRLAGEFERAGETESFWLFEGQRPDGFLANVQYAPGFKWYEVEMLLSLSKPKRTSNYTQPPVLPLSALAQYKSMERNQNPNAKIYLEEMYGRLEKFMGYLYQHRQNSDSDPLLGNIEPHETGMDSLRQWDFIKPHRRPRHPEMTQEEADRNMFADGAHFVIRLFERRVLARGDLRKERELFWVNDVSFNAIYYHNLQAMVRLAEGLGRDKDAVFYRDLSDRVERAMIDKMWKTDSDQVEKPGFYSLDDKGEPIPTITISNLFGLVLPHITEEQLAAVMDMIEDDFNEPFPLPSDSKHSPEYDPENQEKHRIWRGSTWINTNFYLVMFGLRMQAERRDISPELRARCADWAEWISQRSNELIDMNKSEDPENSGAYEFYNPKTGEGQRPEVVNFAWTWLARLMPHKKRSVTAVAA